MSTSLSLSIFVGGPVLGAVCAISLGYTRVWQVMIGALAGALVADLAARAWSNYAAEQALRSGRDVAVARATGLGWRNHVITLTVVAGSAVLIGAAVAFLRRFLVAGQ